MSSIGSKMLPLKTTEILQANRLQVKKDVLIEENYNIFLNYLLFLNSNNNYDSSEVISYFNYLLHHIKDSY